MPSFTYPQAPPAPLHDITAPSPEFRKLDDDTYAARYREEQVQNNYPEAYQVFFTTTGPYLSLTCRPSLPLC